MKLDVYEFTAHNINTQREHTFKVYALPTGEALVPAESTHDSFYESLDAVEGHGNDEIKGYERTGRTVSFTNEEIAESVLSSAREFGEEAIPESLRHWLA